MQPDLTTTSPCFRWKLPENSQWGGRPVGPSAMRVPSPSHVMPSPTKFRVRGARNTLGHRTGTDLGVLSSRRYWERGTAPTTGYTTFPTAACFANTPVIHRHQHAVGAVPAPLWSAGGPPARGCRGLPVPVEGATPTKTPPNEQVVRGRVIPIGAGYQAPHWDMLNTNQIMAPTQSQKKTKPPIPTILGTGNSMSG